MELIPRRELARAEDDLALLADMCRVNALVAVKRAGSGHLGSSFSAMDIVVHASLRPEPLGMVVPEAMGLGRATVASRTRGPEEVIADHETGLLVAPGAVDELTSALTELVASPDLRKRVGDAGQASVLRDWSATRMASEFADLYRTLTGRS